MVKHGEERCMCLACGFNDFWEPTYLQYAGGTYQICPSCGYQEGFSDMESFSFAHWRDLWILGGSRWRGFEEPPTGWNATEQLAGLPTEQWTWRAGDLIEIDILNSEPAYATIEWVHPRNYYLRLAGDLVAACGASEELDNPAFSIVTIDNFLVHGFWRVVGRTEATFRTTPASPRLVESSQMVEALVDAAAGVRNWFPGLDRFVTESRRDRPSL